MFHFYPNVCYLLFRSLEIIIVTSSLQVIPLRMCRQGSCSTHQGKINGDLYSLSASTNKVAFSANKESTDIWHARLGHPSARVLQQLQPHISLHHRLPPSTSPSPPPLFYPSTLSEDLAFPTPLSLDPHHNLSHALLHPLLRYPPSRFIPRLLAATMAPGNRWFFSLPVILSPHVS